MTGSRVRRFLLVLAALALTAAPLRGPGSAHCSEAPGGSPAGHEGHHGSGPVAPGHQHPIQDSGEPGECPHCPPVQCGAQPSCSLQVTDVVTTSSLSHTAGGPQGLPATSTATPRSTTLDPPTPPPQRRG